MQSQKMCFLGLLLSCVLLSVNALYAEEFQYTCVSDNKIDFYIKDGQVKRFGDKQWVNIYSINTKNKTVEKKSGGELGGAPEKVVYPEETVITVSKERISTMKSANPNNEYANVILYKTFFLEKNIMVQTGHTSGKEIYTSTWSCVKN